MKKVRLFIQLFIMAVAVAIHRIIAVLKFPEHISEFPAYARGIYNSMTGNAMFAALAAKLADLDTAIKALEAQMAGMAAIPPTATSTGRNLTLDAVKALLRFLRNAVQDMADASVVTAEDIITAAGMHVKKIGMHNKQNFEVKNGETSGTVILVAKGIEGSGAHEWQYRKHGDDWTNAPTTIYATTTVSGLIAGEEYEFRHRAILPAGPQEYDEDTFRVS